MKYKLIGSKNNIVHVDNCPLIKDGQSALDMAMTLNYETGCSMLVIAKSYFAEEFFVLSTGVAGEVLQKFANYRIQVAIVGDYSGYTSKPLKDFIYESNKGSTVFFVNTVEEAVEKLENLNPHKI